MTHEILTPTEKLKALRETAKYLADGLGKVVTYDDDTTQELMNEAEHHAVVILKTIHDGNHEDISHAIVEHTGGAAEVMRFEHSIDALQERKEHLYEAFHALVNVQKNNMSDAAAAILSAEATHIGRQIEDIVDTINNLYAIREFCPSE